MTAAAAMWHSVEHAGFEADLPVWSALAETAKGPVAELGSGTGRVALNIANQGYPTIAVDRDERLLTALRANQSPGSRVTTLCSDLLQMQPELLFDCDLVLAPLLLVNTIAAEGELGDFFLSVRGACQRGTRLAVAYVSDLGRSRQSFPSRTSFSPAGGGQDLIRSEVDEISFDGEVHTVRWKREIAQGNLEASYQRLRELVSSDLDEAAAPHFERSEALTIPSSGGVVEMNVVVFHAA
ncbi:MAG: class I SAM-dependent methyltransferase [Solirubrobacterales bacterium]|nr:class I SAM-dependent methyltransferase [Solirubrobacterales bacterium]